MESCQNCQWCKIEDTVKIKDGVKSVTNTTTNKCRLHQIEVLITDKCSNHNKIRKELQYE